MDNVINKQIKEDLLEKIVFLMGIFTNMSIVTIFNNTIFMYLSLCFCALCICKYQKLYIKINLILFYIAIGVLSLFFCFINERMGTDWKIAVVKNVINLILYYMIYIYIMRKRNFIKQFFKGIYVSCILQLVWVCLQFVLFRLFSIDLNMYIFGTGSQYKAGTLVANGFTTNAGILVPIYIIGFLQSSNILLKILFVTMACVSGGATSMIAMVSCVIFLSLVKVVKKKKINRNLGKIIKPQNIILVGLSIIFLYYLWTHPDVVEIFESIYNRIVSVLIKGEATSGSDRVHMRYYTSIPEILKNSNLINILFGFGLGTSGFIMSDYFGQYLNIGAWVIESDFVNLLYSVGIVGVLLFYSILLYLLIKGMKINIKISAFVFSVIIAGLFYNVQLHWMILVEFLLYSNLKNGVDCWKWISTKNESNGV